MAHAYGNGLKSRPDRADAICYVCKQRGHYSFACPHKSPKLQGRCLKCGEKDHRSYECTSMFPIMLCLRCGEEGHIVRNCSLSAKDVLMRSQQTNGSNSDRNSYRGKKTRDFKPRDRRSQNNAHTTNHPVPSTISHTVTTAPSPRPDVSLSDSLAATLRDIHLQTFSLPTLNSISPLIGRCSDQQTGTAQSVNTVDPVIVRNPVNTPSIPTISSHPPSSEYVPISNGCCVAMNALYGDYLCLFWNLQKETERN